MKITVKNTNDDSIKKTNDDSIILRQIALSLASIADSLAEINQRLYDIQDTISYRNAED